MDKLHYNAKNVAAAIISDKYPRGLIAPNIIIDNWYEMDVGFLTDAGYLHEFEIKLTKVDFKADAAKKNGYTTKHEALARGEKCCPNRFSFVIPEGLVPLSEIPEFAGCLEVAQQDYGLFLSTSRTAPLIHNKKPDKLRDKFNTSCYHRYMRMFMKVNKWNKYKVKNKTEMTEVQTKFLYDIRGYSCDSYSSWELEKAIQEYFREHPLPMRIS